MRESKHAFYNTIGTTATLSAQWAIMMLIPRITDFTDAGIFAIALSIVSILNIVATFYMNIYQVSDGYRKYSEGDYWLCRLFTIAISFILCPIIVIVFNYSLTQGLVIVGYMLYRNLLHYAYLHMATLQLEDHLDFAGKSMIVEGIVSFIAFMGIYVPTHDLPMQVLVMSVCGGGIFLALLVWGYKHYLNRSYSHANDGGQILRPMILIGIPLLMSGIAPIIITAVPKIILQMDIGDEITGIFSTLTAPTILIPTLVTSVFMPFIVKFSDLQRQGQLKELKMLFLRSVALTQGFGQLCLAISYVFAPWAFQMIYGDYIGQYVWLFNVMIIGITAYSIGQVAITVLISKEQGKWAAYTTFTALAICIVIVATMVSSNGIVGATYALLASYLIFGILTSIAVLVIPLKSSQT